MSKWFVSILFLVQLFLFSSQGFSKDHISVISSTDTYPFSEYLATEFDSVSRYPKPRVDPLETAAAVKLFCKSNGANSGDMLYVSRRMTQKEFKRCKRNGVDALTEILFGYDAAILMQSRKSDDLELTANELMLAVAKHIPNSENTGLVINHYAYWDEINPRLTHRKISIMGPKLNTDVQQMLLKTVVWDQAEKNKVYRDSGIAITNLEFRSDGVYIETDGNNGFVGKLLVKDTNSVGLFNQNFLVKNKKQLVTLGINNKLPTFEHITRKHYPLTQGLYFYVKNDHIKNKTQVKIFADFFFGMNFISEEELVNNLGITPLVGVELNRNRKLLTTQAVLNASEL